MNLFNTKQLLRSSTITGAIQGTSQESFFHCRAESFKNSFFPCTIEAWYSLDPSVINFNSLEVFQSKLFAGSY